MNDCIIIDIIENAITQAGYKVLDRDGSSIVIGRPGEDADYRITVAEEG